MDVSELLPRDSGLVVRDLIEGTGYVRDRSRKPAVAPQIAPDATSDRIQVHVRYVRCRRPPTASP